MRLLFFILGVLVISVIVTLFAMKDPGYVLVDMRGWTIETTVVTGFVVLAIIFTVIYFAIRVVVQMWHMPTDVRHWHQQRQIRKSNQSLTLGLIGLAEGKWQTAERDVLRYADSDNKASLLNYLAAARAAQEQGAYDRRDKYLMMAHKTMPSADIAVGLTQADLQLDQQQLEQALATLRHLSQLDPKHPYVLKTLSRLYTDLNDWEHLIELLPNLRKRKVFSDKKLFEMEQAAYVQLLSRDTINTQDLNQTWYRIPRLLQSDETVLIAYIEQLLRLDSSELAEPLIRNALKTYWSERLVYYYGKIDGADIASQLMFAETWLSLHENNPTILLSLGRLCLKRRLWGKAQNYLEASVGAAALPEAYNELAHLMEQLGETDKAREYYKEGLKSTPGCEVVVNTMGKPSDLEPLPAASTNVALPPGVSVS